MEQYNQYPPQQQYQGYQQYPQQQYPPQQQAMVPQQQAAPPAQLGIDKQSIQRMKDQFAMSLPSFYTADRFVRACYNVLNAKNPKEAKTVQLIRQSTPESFFGCLLACAALGLEPNGPLGHAYIIPFQNWRDRRVISVTCQLIVGYKGLIDLARRSGNVQTIIAHEVRQNDYFKFNFGTGELPIHTFDLQADRGEIIAVYAVARFADNSYHFDLMTKSDVERIRLGSKSKDSDPWKDHYDEMAKKTIIRRIAKYLPMDVQKAAAYDGASLKYDSHAVENSGLVFAGYDEDDTNQLIEEQEQPAAIPAPVVSTKAAAAAESVKAQVKKPKAKQAPAPEPAVDQSQYSVTAADISNDAVELTSPEQFASLLKEVDTLVACSKMDPSERDKAIGYVYEVAKNNNVALPTNVPF